MLKDFLFRKIFRISIGVVGIFILTENAFAGSTKYKNTKQPYWGVGQYNSALSDACRRHEFNQKKVQNLNIGYSGKRGMGVTGIATQAWNLHDPRGLAEVNITYHFFNDRYSNCKVYVARFKRARQ
tara:strand:+ start:198 stop:575 length:378 start_codon:yes stop_codon:yes gene_type:complete